MRGDLDKVEEMSKQKSKIFNKHFVTIIIFLLAFLLFCGLFFNSIFLLSSKIINKIDEKMGQLNKEDKNPSRKTYYIEQQIRKQLENMNKEKK